MTEGYKPVDPRGAVLAFNEGAQAMERGDQEAAVSAWQRALDLDPALVPAALNLITYYQKRGDLEAELQYWNVVLAFDPFNTDHLILQASLYRRLKHYQRAIDNYRRAIAIYPYFKFWYHELADIYQELGDSREASVWRQRGDSLQADEAEICYEDGVRHAEEGHWDSARKHFEAVLDDFPANLDARLRLAEALELCQKTDEALGEYRRAIELTEAGKGLVYFRLGEFLVRQGRIAEAHTAFAQASATAPRYYKAARAVATIEEMQHKFEAPSVQPAVEPSVPAPPLATPTPPPAQILKAPEPAPAQATRRAPPTDQWLDLQVTGPAQQEPRLLLPEDIEMELVEERLVDHGKPPVFRTLNTQLPWQHQLRQVLDQALAVSDPAGLMPRVAVAFEPDAVFSGAISIVLSEIRALGRSLRADEQESHVFLVQAAGSDERRWQEGVSYGWLGFEETPSLDPERWSLKPGQISLGRTLDCVSQAGGVRGFNCLLLVSAGRCRRNATNPREVAQKIPLHAFCFIHPRYHYIDIRLALQDVVPNYLEITL